MTGRFTGQISGPSVSSTPVATSGGTISTIASGIGQLAGILQESQRQQQQPTTVRKNAVSQEDAGTVDTAIQQGVSTFESLFDNEITNTEKAFLGANQGRTRKSMFNTVLKGTLNSAIPALVERGYSENQARSIIADTLKKRGIKDPSLELVNEGIERQDSLQKQLEDAQYDSMFNAIENNNFRPDPALNAEENLTKFNRMVVKREESSRAALELGIQLKRADGTPVSSSSVRPQYVDYVTSKGDYVATLNGQLLSAQKEFIDAKKTGDPQLIAAEARDYRDMYQKYRSELYSDMSSFTSAERRDAEERYGSALSVWSPDVILAKSDTTSIEELANDVSAQVWINATGVTGAKLRAMKANIGEQNYTAIVGLNAAEALASNIGKYTRDIMDSLTEPLVPGTSLEDPAAQNFGSDGNTDTVQAAANTIRKVTSGQLDVTGGTEVLELDLGNGFNQIQKNISTLTAPINTGRMSQSEREELATQLVSPRLMKALKSEKTAEGRTAAAANYKDFFIKQGLEELTKLRNRGLMEDFAIISNATEETLDTIRRSPTVSAPRTSRQQDLVQIGNLSVVVERRPFGPFSRSLGSFARKHLEGINQAIEAIKQVREVNPFVNGVDTSSMSDTQLTDFLLSSFGLETTQASTGESDS